MKKVLKIGGIILGGIILVMVLSLATLYAAKWVVIKKEKVRLGFAETNFPFRNYSIEELNKMYPQIKYADVQTRVTPEETYTRFRQALKDNNLEMAIEQLSKWESGVEKSNAPKTPVDYYYFMGEEESKRKYEENAEMLTKAYNEGKFAEAYENYPEKIEKSSMSETLASYYYFRNEDGRDFKIHISFVKDANGDWKMDSL